MAKSAMAEWRTCSARQVLIRERWPVQPELAVDDAGQAARRGEGLFRGKCLRGKAFGSRRVTAVFLKLVPSSANVCHLFGENSAREIRKDDRVIIPVSRVSKLVRAALGPVVRPLPDVFAHSQVKSGQAKARPT
jgi:hypothetical protein